MKQIIIMIVILLIIFTGAWYIQKFLDDTSYELVNELEDLKTGLEEDINEEKLKEKSNEVYGQWKDMSERWSVIVLHDELDLIETSIIKVKSKIEVGNLDESKEDVDTSIFLLKHIAEKEKTSLKNIF